MGTVERIFWFVALQPSPVLAVLAVLEANYRPGLPDRCSLPGQGRSALTAFPAVSAVCRIIPPIDGSTWIVTDAASPPC
ncbi:hypothetical protein RRG08_026600 [Elysia crispata]|uniref:Secreted protein n=1 Tax=Elysia crispata TaxID=231223 RepID=A0AAE0ZRA9_9GAST|nr:hypothetical protein RRG08_026600 [Elysia crispata]